MSGSTASLTKRLPTWVVATVAGFFGLFYAYVVWNAATLLAYQASGVLGLNALGWFVLVFAVLFPIVVFAIAFGIARRRPLLPLIVTFLTGLALVAVLWLNVLAYAYSYGADLLG